MLVLILAALGMSALVPAGMMIAPSNDHFVAITLCPETHPLARAVQAQAAEVETDDQAASHHAAMGHGSGGESEPSPTSLQASGDCAFSLLAFAALAPDDAVSLTAGAQRPQLLANRLDALALPVSGHLRPPSRAPPYLS